MDCAENAFNVTNLFMTFVVNLLSVVFIFLKQNTCISETVFEVYVAK